MARLKNKRRRGYTRISSKHQVTIPASVLRETRLAAGDATDRSWRRVSRRARVVA